MIETEQCHEDVLVRLRWVGTACAAYDMHWREIMQAGSRCITVQQRVRVDQRRVLRLHRLAEVPTKGATPWVSMSLLAKHVEEQQSANKLGVAFWRGGVALFLRIFLNGVSAERNFHLQIEILVFELRDVLPEGNHLLCSFEPLHGCQNLRRRLTITQVVCALLPKALAGSRGFRY